MSAMSLADVYYSDGYEEGWREEKLSIAMRMLRDKVPVDFIGKYIGLSDEELRDLAEEVKAETES